MFNSITLHGGTASLLCGYRTAATLRDWRISKQQDGWILTAGFSRVDAFQVRQTPLFFTAPRDKGQWCWPVTTVEIGPNQRVGPNQIRATLGQPEQ